MTGSVNRPDLVAALAAGDKGAEAILVTLIESGSRGSMSESLGLSILSEWLQSRITRFLGSTLMAGLPNDVDQVWNDTLERIHSTIREFDASRSRFRTWVYNTARFVAMDAVRSQTRSAEKERLAHAGLPMHFDDVDDIASFGEIAAMKRAIERLSETQSKLLKLRFVEGFSYQEISSQQERSDVPADHLRVYANRALQKLKTLYLEERRKT